MARLTHCRSKQCVASPGCVPITPLRRLIRLTIPKPCIYSGIFHCEKAAFAPVTAKPHHPREINDARITALTMAVERKPRLWRQCPDLAGRANSLIGQLDMVRLAY